MSAQSHSSGTQSLSVLYKCGARALDEMLCMRHDMALHVATSCFFFPALLFVILWQCFFSQLLWFHICRCTLLSSLLMCVGEREFFLKFHKDWHEVHNSSQYIHAHAVTRLNVFSPFILLPLLLRLQSGCGYHCCCYLIHFMAIKLKENFSSSKWLVDSGALIPTRSFKVGQFEFFFFWCLKYALPILVCETVISGQNEWKKSLHFPPYSIFMSISPFNYPIPRMDPP